VRTVRRTPNSADRRGSQTSLCRATSRSVLLTLWIRSTSLGGRQRNTSTRHSRGKSSSIFDAAWSPGATDCCAAYGVCQTWALDVTPFLVAVTPHNCRELTPFESELPSAAAPRQVYVSAHGLLFGTVRPQDGFTPALVGGGPEQVE